MTTPTPGKLFRWRKPSDIRKFPESWSVSWDDIVPILIVLPGFKYPEVGYFLNDTGLWYQTLNPFPVVPTHWQRMPRIPNKP